MTYICTVIIVFSYASILYIVCFDRNLNVRGLNFNFGEKRRRYRWYSKSRTHDLSIRSHSPYPLPQTREAKSIVIWLEFDNPVNHFRKISFSHPVKSSVPSFKETSYHTFCDLGWLLLSISSRRRVAGHEDTDRQLVFISIPQSSRNPTAPFKSLRMIASQ